MNKEDLREVIENIFMKYPGFHSLRGELIDWPIEAVDALESFINQQRSEILDEIESGLKLMSFENGEDDFTYYDTDQVKQLITKLRGKHG